jgi:hypothetical protein
VGELSFVVDERAFGLVVANVEGCGLFPRLNVQETLSLTRTVWSHAPFHLRRAFEPMLRFAVV